MWHPAVKPGNSSDSVRDGRIVDISSAETGLFAATNAMQQVANSCDNIQDRLPTQAAGVGTNSPSFDCWLNYKRPGADLKAARRLAANKPASSTPATMV